MKNKTTKIIQANYEVAMEVGKPAGDIFYHLTKNVSRFWPEEIQGECSGLYDEFIFKTGDSHYSKNKVVELVPDKKVVWLVTESIRKTDNFCWTGTKMIFELTPHDESTLLQFTYCGAVLENETDQLARICDMVIKENLRDLIESFTATIEVAKTPQEVFESISEVPKWWSKDFEGSSKNLNDEFIIHHPGRHYSKQEVVEVVADKKIVWLVSHSKLDWIEKDKCEWTNTKMIFDISMKGDKTVLHFTHLGLTKEKECYTMCEEGWNMVIKSRLFNFITIGKQV